jgi:hypothetical protein
MSRFFLWIAAVALTIPVGLIIGVAAAVLHTLVAGPNNFASPFFGGFMAATVMWPFNAWLERRFGIAA